MIIYKIREVQRWTGWKNRLWMDRVCGFLSIRRLPEHQLKEEYGFSSFFYGYLGFLE